MPQRATAAIVSATISRRSNTDSHGGGGAGDGGVVGLVDARLSDNLRGGGAHGRHLGAQVLLAHVALVLRPLQRRLRMRKRSNNYNTSRTQFIAYGTRSTLSLPD